ncbi:MAG: tetratricopeptide repeat protein [Myxococcales bacterium]|nr:tetratricopeptide repeat protein [Myxococcales bacterium]
MRAASLILLLAWGACAAGPTPRRLALSDLVPWGLELASERDPAGVEDALRARVLARAPEVDPGPSVALLLVQVGARRLQADPPGGLALMERGLAGVVQAFPPADPVRLRTARAVADALRLNGRPNAAEPLYEHLLAHHREAHGGSDPRTLLLWVDLGDTQRRQKAFDVAEATLAAARAAAHTAGVVGVERAADLGLGRLYAETAQLEKAEATLRRALPQPPDVAQPAAHLELADVLRAQGRLTAALAALAPLLAAPEPPLPALRLASELAFAQGRYDRSQAWLSVGLARVEAADGPKAAALMPWLHGLANAAGAAGRHAEAEGFVTRARGVAYAHEGLLPEWTPQFMALNQRLDQARALARRAALPPARPLALPKPLPPPPNRKLARLDEAALRARALDQATRGDFKAAARVGQRLVAQSDRGRQLLAGWLAQAGELDAALWWLMEAVEREGADPAEIAREPDLQPLRQDPRWYGVSQWIDAHGLHWTVHGPTARVALPGPADAPVTVLLPDDGEAPAAVLDEARHGGWARTHGPLLAVSGTWAQGPARWRWAGRPEADGPHLLRQLDAAGFGDRPVRLVGLGAAAAVAAQLAAGDPDRFVGAVTLGRLPDGAVPALAHRARDQRWVVACEAGARPTAPLVETLQAAGARIRCAPAGRDWLAALKARGDRNPR